VDLLWIDNINFMILIDSVMYYCYGFLNRKSFSQCFLCMCEKTVVCLPSNNHQKKQNKNKKKHFGLCYFYMKQSQLSKSVDFT